MAPWKVILLVVLMVGLALGGGLMLSAGLYFYFQAHSPQAPVREMAQKPALALSSVPLPVRPTLAFTPVTNLDDIDALAARMTKGHDLYVSIRDQALAAYAKQNPTPGTYDEAMKRLIRATAYDLVWYDRYHENLWKNNMRTAAAVQTAGVHDPIVDLVMNYDWFDNRRFDYPQRFADLQAAIETMQKTDYPPAIHLEACSIALRLIINYKTKYHLTLAKTPAMDVLPALLALWGQSYRELIAQQAPNEFLFQHGADLQGFAKKDEEALDLVIAEQDRAFNDTKPDHPARWALDGEFWTNAAWCARGSGWANSVTADGWRVFHERLQNARATLEKGYGKYPQEAEISHLMMTVTLGQESGADEMEMWFQRAIKADPDDSEAYFNKEWFLQPRWYGSVPDQLAFGKECVKTQNWESNVPMVFTKGIALAADNQPDLYAQPDIWTPTEKTYRDFLARYPASNYFRTFFAKHAYDGDHWDVARQQFKILGDKWDRSVISEVRHQTIMTDLTR